MADKKISALTAASTPLAGTEVLPIVQSGATVKVAVSDLTSGRTVAASRLDTSNSTAGGVMATLSSGWSNTTITLKGDGATGAGVMNISNVAASAALPYQLQLNGTKVLGSDTSGNVDVTVGNLVIGTSGKGIDFSATPGTGTSELFADYEEGTWTPDVYGDGGSAGAVAFTSSGKYTKVGRQVTITGSVAFTNLGSWTGRIGISGVPFTISADTYFGGFGGANTNIGAVTTVSPWIGGISLSGINFAVTSAISSGMDSVRFTQLTSTSTLFFTLTYFV